MQGCGPMMKQALKPENAFAGLRPGGQGGIAQSRISSTINTQAILHGSCFEDYLWFRHLHPDGTLGPMTAFDAFDGLANLHAHFELRILRRFS